MSCVTRPPTDKSSGAHKRTLQDSPTSFFDMLMPALNTAASKGGLRSWPCSVHDGALLPLLLSSLPLLVRG